MSHFPLLNKHHKPTDHERDNLECDRNYLKLWTERHSVSVDVSYMGRMTVYKHLQGLPDASLSFTNLLLETICQTQITVGERKTHAVHKQASFPQRTSELS